MPDANTATGVVRARRPMPASFSPADLAMRRAPHPVPSAGRDAAPSGEPVPLAGTGGEGSPTGADAGYVIRCAAGMPTAPAFYPQGKFLGWIGGHFIPCCRSCFAMRYSTRAIARAVATRAEIAFPGSRFEVLSMEGARL